MAEPTTLVCIKCGAGGDPSQFPLEAISLKTAQICANCMTPTHQCRNQNDCWKPCVTYCVNPSTPGQLNVRDAETSEVHTIGHARIRPYDRDNEQEQDEETQKEMLEPHTNGSTESDEEQEENLPDDSHNKNEKKSDSTIVKERSDNEQPLEPEEQV